MSSPLADTAFDALASPIRRKIIGFLSEQPHAVGELAARLPVSRPAISKHLRLLESAGFVRSQAQGNRNVYRLEGQGFEIAKSWLDAFWNDALARFKLAAENTYDAAEDQHG